MDARVNNPTLVLAAGVAAQIEREGIVAYPDECCGILIGRDGQSERIVEALVPMRNVFDEQERYHRFRIDEKQLIQTEKQVSERGQVVLGFYHSHPDHPARPSEYDREHVPPWAFYSHVIVAIHNRVAVDMTCWQMDESTEQFREQTIRRND